MKLPRTLIIKKKSVLNDRHFRMPTRIGITGYPATGKKSIGLALSRITGLNFLSINEYAISRKYGRWKGGEFEVDIQRLEGKIPTEGNVVVGHLLPYVIPRNEVEFVAILRCSPAVLKKRYAERAYSKSKILENIEAEALDIIAQKALSVFGEKKVSEFNTTRTRNPETTTRKIIATLRGKRERTFGAINWMGRTKSAGQLTSLLRPLE